MTKNDDPQVLGKTTIYLIENDNNFFVFCYTKQEILKYLNNIKTRSKKDTDLKKILSTNYTYKLIEEIELKKLKNRLEELKLIKSHTITQALKYGKKEEYLILEKLNNYFRNDMIIMSKFEFSHFDFLGLKSKYIYELKSNKDKFNDYPNAIIGIEKVIESSNQIFLFQFINDKGSNDLYYFIKPQDFIKNYKKREIYLKYRNKYNTIFDIPREELIKINDNDFVNLAIKNEPCLIFEKLKYLDQISSEYQK